MTLSGCMALKYALHGECSIRYVCVRHQLYLEQKANFGPPSGFSAYRVCRTEDYPHFIHIPFMMDWELREYWNQNIGVKDNG